MNILTDRGLDQAVGISGFAEDVGVNPFFVIGGAGAVGALIYRKNPVYGFIAGALAGAYVNYWTIPCWTGVLTQGSNCRKAGGCK